MTGPILRLAAMLALLALGSCSPFGAPGVADTQVGASLVPTSHGAATVRLAVEEHGAGPPLVLLHGLGISSFTWRALISELARHHRVITIDLKGFGRSDKPLDTAYALADQATLVASFLREQKLANVTLVGHSFGGGIALAVALDEVAAPQRRVSRLVLIDSIAYSQPSPIFFRLLQMPVVGEVGLTLLPADVQTWQAMKLAFVDDSRIAPEAVAAYAAGIADDSGRHALRETVAAIGRLDADSFARRYPALKLPALLVWCDQDRIVPIEFGRRLVADLPNATLHVIKGCGHMPQEEKPRETLAALLAFLQPGKDKRS